MSRHEAGVCSTIYRLNLAMAAALAFILLGEEVSVSKILGIACAIIAVFLFFPKKEKKETSKSSPCPNGGTLALIIVICASLLRAGMGVTYKHGLTLGAEMNGILAINGLMWMIGGVFYMLTKEKHAISKRVLNKKNIFYGAASGALICGIVYFMASALKHGDASLALPVSQMSFLITSMLGIIILKESFTIKKLLGIGCSIMCIVFMSMNI